jgi:hypothetical protein
MSISGARRPAWALLLTLLAGCSRTDGDLPAVEGRVFYRGAPVAGGTVVFTPDPDRGGSGPLATAEIDNDGHYALKTNGKAGATVGWHRVTVASRDPAALPRRFADPELSGQRREVKPGAPNTIDLNLE